jgi:hypothetical protein
MAQCTANMSERPQQIDGALCMVGNKMYIEYDHCGMLLILARIRDRRLVLKSDQ